MNKPFFVLISSLEHRCSSVGVVQNWVPVSLLGLVYGLSVMSNAYGVLSFE